MALTPGLRKKKNRHPKAAEFLAAETQLYKS